MIEICVDSCGMNHFGVCCKDHRMTNSNYCLIHDDMTQEGREQQIILYKEGKK